MKTIVKKLLRKTPVYSIIQSIYRRLRNVPRHPLQNFKTKPGYRLKRLGTASGGWVFVDDVALKGCTIISAGLGEDASFDVEFARRYNAKVVVVDPTPRAIRHVGEIINSLGSQKNLDYEERGKQPIRSYDLTDLMPGDITIVPKALWNKNGMIKFFEPRNPEDVSHSIVNYQNEYSEETNYIEVESTTVSTLMAELDIKVNDISLIKLDIEGAEIEVIKDFLGSGFLPRQILVEFDELNAPSERAFKRVDEIHDELERYGYQCIQTDGQADFLYLRV